MFPSCESGPSTSRDLARGWTSWLLWGLPIIALIVGGVWSAHLVWFWVPAFVVMGAACLVNAARCGRTHCYVTGPLFLLAALWVLLSAWGIVPLESGPLALVVFVICSLACCAETPFGRYRQARR